MGVTEQTEEIETIKVIYEGDIAELESKKIKLTLNISILERIQILLKSANNHIVGMIDVQYLPPVEVYFEFPENYPEQSSPNIEIKALWLTNNLKIKTLSKIKELCENLIGNPVVFEITNWIQADLIPFLFEINSNTIELQEEVRYFILIMANKIIHF